MQLKHLEYFKIPNDVKVANVKGVWRINHYIQKLQNLLINKQKIKISNNESKIDKRVVISLTTFPERINLVSTTIKTLLNQTVKVDEIILWLAQEQFAFDDIPKELKELQQYGLSIRFCDDIKSHKKYYYTMAENPEDIIITADDDIIYPENSIEKLLLKHHQYPNCIICNEGREIMFDENNNILSYKYWKKNTIEGVRNPSSKILPIGCGGVLYPPNSLDNEVFNKEKLKDMALYTDDIWLKFMSTYKRTKIIKTSRYSKPVTSIPGSQEKSLKKTNVDGGNNNDMSITKLMQIYPEFNKLVQENTKNHS